MYVSPNLYPSLCAQYYLEGNLTMVPVVYFLELLFPQELDVAIIH